MGKLVLLLIATFFMPSTTMAAASDEIYQLISFRWDSTTSKLTPYSIGSGTSVYGVGIITNRHVVFNAAEDRPTDFVLLCRASLSRNDTSKCSTPAAVTAYHEEIDVALVQPLNGEPLYPSTAPESLKQQKGDQVRIYSFPYSSTNDSFGDQNTLNRLTSWAEKGGKLSNLGDKITITRGKITNTYQDSFGNSAYYGSNAKGDFGSSGGGAFTNTGRYIGIPSYKDKSGNIILIAYSEIIDWVHENKNIRGNVSSDILKYYNTHMAQPKKQLTPRYRTSARSRMTIKASAAKKRIFKRRLTSLIRKTKAEKIEPTIGQPIHDTYIESPKPRREYLGEP